MSSSAETCTATKRDGTPCASWAIAGDPEGRCYHHSSATHDAAQESRRKGLEKARKVDRSTLLRAPLLDSVPKVTAWVRRLSNAQLAGRLTKGDIDAQQKLIASALEALRLKAAVELRDQIAEARASLAEIVSRAVLAPSVAHRPGAAVPATRTLGPEEGADGQ